MIIINFKQKIQVKNNVYFQSYLVLTPEYLLPKMPLASLKLGFLLAAVVELELLFILGNIPD